MQVLFYIFKFDQYSFNTGRRNVEWTNIGQIKRYKTILAFIIELVQFLRKYNSLTFLIRDISTLAIDVWCSLLYLHALRFVLSSYNIVVSSFHKYLYWNAGILFSNYWKTTQHTYTDKLHMTWFKSGYKVFDKI